MADFLSQLFCLVLFSFLSLAITITILTYIHKTQIRGDIKFKPQLILIQVSVHSDSKPLMLSVLYVNQLETKTIFYFLSLNSNSPLSNRI